MSCAYNSLYIQFKFSVWITILYQDLETLRAPTLHLSLQSQGNFHYGRNPLKKKKNRLKLLLNIAFNVYQLWSQDITYQN